MLIILGCALLFLGALLIPILMPHLAPSENSVDVAFSLGDFVIAFSPSLIFLCSIGTLAAVASSRVGSIRLAWRFVCRQPTSEAEALEVSQVLKSASYAVTSAGIVIGFIGALFMLARPWGSGEYPTQTHDIAILTAMEGLLLGRVLLGALAEGALHRSGSCRRPHFSFSRDLGLLSALAIPPLFMLVFVSPIPS